jgi:hypothetical protein
LASSEPSTESAAWRIGQFLTGTEARELATRLADGDTLTAALRVITPGRRTEARALLEAARGHGLTVPGIVFLLHAVGGARSVPTTVDPLWTMPGHLARHGQLTCSVSHLVDKARNSVTCSTYNFQRSSSLWTALAAAAQRPGLSVRVYLDTAAADHRRVPGSPTTADVAAQLHPATVLRTRPLADKPIRNHAKFLAIDHRFLLVTSANFSWSAEHGNVEFGVLIDNRNLAESVEREMRLAEDLIFARV